MAKKERKYKTEPKKDPILAMLLSFFIVGLGQIYCGEIGRGIVLFLLEVLVCIPLCMVGIGFLLVPALKIYASYDAYKIAENSMRIVKEC